MLLLKKIKKLKMHLLLIAAMMMSLAACGSASLTPKGNCPLSVNPQSCAVDYYQALLDNNQSIINDVAKKKCFTHWIDKLDLQQDELDAHNRLTPAHTSLFPGM